MANWNKLDTELSNKLENMSKEDWMLWRANQQHNKIVRRAMKQLQANLYLSRKTLSQVSENCRIEVKKTTLQEVTHSSHIDDVPILTFDEIDFALAA